MVPEPQNTVLDEQVRSGSFGAYKNYRNLMGMDSNEETAMAYGAPRASGAIHYNDYNTMDESTMKHVMTSIPSQAEMMLQRKYESVATDAWAPVKSKLGSGL